MTETDRIARAYRDLDERAATRWDLRNAGNQRILSERRGLIQRLLQRRGWLPLRARRVLDVGSGSGAELAWFRELGAGDSDLVGIDLLPERVEIARRAFPGIAFHVGNAEHLPFPDRSFDLVVAYTVFSSKLDNPGLVKAMNEQISAMKKDGTIEKIMAKYNMANPAFLMK